MDTTTSADQTGITLQFKKKKEQVIVKLIRIQTKVSKISIANGSFLLAQGSMNEHSRGSCCGWYSLTMILIVIITHEHRLYSG